MKMTFKQKLLVAGGFVLTGLMFFAIGGAFILTQPLVDAANGYLELLSQDEFELAYAMTTERFRGGQSCEEFAKANKDTFLNSFESVSWHNRNMCGDTGRLDGYMTTDETLGFTFGITATLQKQAGQWKIDSIDLFEP